MNPCGLKSFQRFGRLPYLLLHEFGCNSYKETKDMKSIRIRLVTARHALSKKSIKRANGIRFGRASTRWKAYFNAHVMVLVPASISFWMRRNWSNNPTVLQLGFLFLSPCNFSSLFPILEVIESLYNVKVTSM